jgi:hypothetical protein
MHYANQHAALVAAAQIVEELPPDTTFGVAITDGENDAELNIFVKTFGERVTIIRKIVLDQPVVDEGERFITYQIGPLVVSIILPEENT